MKKNRFIFYILVSISFMFSQSEYQILSISKNVFELSNNGASFAMPNENNLTNPASFKIGYNHYGFSMINYGIFSEDTNLKATGVSIRNYTLGLRSIGKEPNLGSV